MIYIALISAIFFVLIVPAEFSAAKRDAIKFIEKTCVLKSDIGRKCKGHKESKVYYFNVKTFRCGSFSYLGCGGNANRFKTFDECVDSCQTPWFALKNSEADETSRTKEDCSLSPVVGNCKALIPMWYFDKQTNNCSGFAYGGCGGNGNRFNDEDECLQFCQPEEK